MRAITRIVGAGAAAVLALTLTACSDSSDGTATPQQTATQEAGQDATAEPDADAGTDSGEGLTVENFADVVSASVTKNTRYRMTTTVEGSGFSSTTVSDVVVDGTSIATKAVTTTEGIESTIVVIGTDYYMNLGAMSDNKYFKLDLDDESNPMAKAMADAAVNASPQKTFEAMSDAVTSVEKVGEEDVAGISTTHYAVEMDMSAFLAGSLGDLTGSTAAPSADTTVTADYWLDADNRIVKSTVETMGITTESVYSDWDDASITVVAPKSSEITDKDPFAGLGS